MATKYAKGKKSLAICDRSGLRVKYTDLKTTWDGLRVSPDQWEPKHPQLTPRKNVIDATALFDARPNRDPENVEIFIGYNYDPFIDPRQRPEIGVGSLGTVGFSFVETRTDAVTGVAGTGSVGNELIDLSINETGVAGTGNTGTVGFIGAIGVSGNGGTGSVGVESLSLSIDEAGVGGTGGVGNEALEMSISESGVAGTGAVGSESVTIDESFWGSGEWNEGTWGN